MVELLAGGEKHQRTAVCYLSRLGNPGFLTRNFFHSLLVDDSHQNCDLWVILKGYGPDQTDPVLAGLPAKLRDRIRLLRINDNGYDINAYFAAAAAIDSPLFLFFNSYSQLLGANWLEYYHNAFEKIGGDGLVGATGSFERMLEDDPWPNIHIRSNGFMIARDRFLNINAGPLETKRDCNRFEAGPGSMTRQILEDGKQVVLVDKSGRVVKPQDWPGAGIFRSHRQQNLLVGDNRCYAWDMARNSKRRRLARLAFGDQAIAPNIGLVDRGKAFIQWNKFRLRSVLNNGDSAGSDDR